MYYVLYSEGSLGAVSIIFDSLEIRRSLRYSCTLKSLAQYPTRADILFHTPYFKNIAFFLFSSSHLCSVKKIWDLLSFGPPFAMVTNPRHTKRNH